MKMVIDIPDEMYDTINRGIYSSTYDGKIIRDIVLDGTPLPKGHGRLIDADAFKQKVCTYQETGCGSCKHQLCCPEDAPTIIEANKESN